MKWPWQDKDRDGKIDDFPFDTYTEIFLAWIALALTALVIISIAYLIFGV